MVEHGRRARMLSAHPVREQRRRQQRELELGRDALGECEPSLRVGFGTGGIAEPDTCPRRDGESEYLRGVVELAPGDDRRRKVERLTGPAVLEQHHGVLGGQQPVPRRAHRRARGRHRRKTFVASRRVEEAELGEPTDGGHAHGVVAGVLGKVGEDRLGLGVAALPAQ